MKKVAIFGKPGNGKSTLGKQLASATGIPLYALDSVLYHPDGQEVDRHHYRKAHQDILSSEAWIIEGFGPISSLDSFNQRLAAADTLIYIELSYFTTYYLVTKRLVKGLFKKPEGWPDGSSVLEGTMKSYKILKRCPEFWNQRFLQRLEGLPRDKSLYVIRSMSELNSVVEKIVPSMEDD